MKSMKTIVASLAAVGLIAACGGGGSSSGASGASVSTAKTCPQGITMGFEKYLSEKGKANIASGALIELTGETLGTGLMIKLEESDQEALGNAGINLSVKDQLTYGDYTESYTLALIYDTNKDSEDEATLRIRYVTDGAMGYDSYDWNAGGLVFPVNPDSRGAGLESYIDVMLNPGDTTQAYEEAKLIEAMKATDGTFDLEKLNQLLSVFKNNISNKQAMIDAVQAKIDSGSQVDEEGLAELRAWVEASGLDADASSDELSGDLAVVSGAVDGVQGAIEAAGDLKEDLEGGVLNLAGTEVSHGCLKLIMENVLLNKVGDEVVKIDLSNNKSVDKDSLKIVLDALNAHDDEGFLGTSVDTLDFTKTDVTEEDFTTLLESTDKQGNLVYGDLFGINVLYEPNVDMHHGDGVYMTPEVEAFHEGTLIDPSDDDDDDHGDSDDNSDDYY